MKKWGILVLLLLSIGLNAGLLISYLSRGSAGSSPGGQVPGSTVFQESGDVTLTELPPRLRRLIRRMANDLELRGDDRRRFFEVQEVFFRTSFDAQRRLRQIERRIRAELASDTPERSVVEEHLQQIAATRLEQERAFLDNYFATRQLLSPGQEERFRRFMARIRELRRELDRRAQKSAGRRLGR